ncbi:MAG TPA: VTT domain-containing protein [Kiritimatiellia bacterium]|jgi:uncharacterized membrane protein YdjX (TVP38/TMEM64 family)|nr:VTT domain-containing protein [Kiritimatiellia bacterium]HOR98381.1 VTT domain-containing protein [Kiritimatiellia bacterium]HPC48975.1 VTT domain-containing protein [Kiritimatiellia bacterium]HPW76114.1 VTT domain-containing protein [Kiritimatiellia bacterium]
MPNLPYRTLSLLTLVLLAVILPFFLFADAVQAWTDALLRHAQAHPLQTGLLLTALLASDIVVPVPSSLVSTACGMTLGFVAGTCASFIGMSASALVGLLMGRMAAPAAQRLIGADEVRLLQSFHARYGIWLLLALRPVPVLAEASVVFSGLARQPFGRAFAITLLGNAAVSAVYAAVGAWGRLADSFLPAFGASMLLAGALYLPLRRRGQHRATLPPPRSADTR